jgi:hypothetical protein
MKFNPYTKQLFTDDDVFIKRFHCPENITWYSMPESDLNCRFCEHCDKPVYDIKDLSDDDVLAILGKEADACFKLDLDYPNVKIVSSDFQNKNPMELRVIQTARDEESINSAIDAGYTPLLKRVKKSKEICSKYAIIKNKKTGKIKQIGDFRDTMRLDHNLYEIVLDFEFYYPHSFPSPFAAYLIPSNLKVGQSVWLEDLIEDYISSRWNQGDVNRLESCEAIWNGKDLEITFDLTPIRELIG